MELRKRLYTVVILLAVVIVGLLLFVWLAGNPAIGTESGITPPQLSQSVGDAAQILRTWIATNWAGDGSVVACTLTISKHDPATNNWTFQVYSKRGKPSAGGRCAKPGGEGIA